MSPPNIEGAKPNKSTGKDPSNNNRNQNQTTPSDLHFDAATTPAAASSLLLLFLRLPLPPGCGNTCLDTSVWDYLSLRDLTQLRLLSRGLRKALDRVEYSRCRDGRDYLVPFPGFPGVLTTQSDRKEARLEQLGGLSHGNHHYSDDACGSEASKMVQGLFCHQLASLESMYKAENRCTDFGALRGGILGDAPGLGKTITMLSLIASTAGMRVRNPTEFWDADTIREGWESFRLNDAADGDVAKALLPINRWVRSKLQKNSPGYLAFIDLCNYIRPSYKDDRLQTISDFTRHVLRTMRPFVPTAPLEMFRSNITELKEGLDKRSRKLRSTYGRRLAEERSLLPCGATLIVVPDALLEHWCEQMHRHLDMEVFSDSNENTYDNINDINGNIADAATRGVVFLDGIGDLYDTHIPLTNVSMNRPMESASYLSKHLVVVTTFSRCMREYLREARSRGKKRKRGHGALSSSDLLSSERSPLLRIRWLRLIVDEGHELGKNEAGSGLTHFIREIAAERRWVMSGSPTTGDEDHKNFNADGLDQLQRLLQFLRHPKYGNESQNEWDLAVKEPFLAREDRGRQELLRVLDEVMSMHRKEDINLPKPIFKQAEVAVPVPDNIQSLIVEAAAKQEVLDFSYLAATLRTIGVDADQCKLKAMLKQLKKSNGAQAAADLILAEYLHSNDYQLLVDEAQGSYIVSSIMKEREALFERGGSQNETGVTALASDVDARPNSWVDRRPIKAVVYSSSNTNLISVAEQIFGNGMIAPENIAEMAGGDIQMVDNMSVELSRFRNGCRQGRNCPICGKWNDLDGRMHTCDNILLEVCDSEGERFLVERERIVRALPFGESTEDDIPDGNVESMRANGEPLTNYRKFPTSFWRVGDVLEVCCRDPHPLLSSRWSSEEWENHGSQKCIQMASKDDYLGRDWYFGPLPSSETSDTKVVTLTKWQKCSTFHSPSRWYSGPQLTDMPIKTIKEDVFILCLHSGLSHGLDLSFVTHIYLLEPIDDAALLEQVTSRAHRLGATGPVVVETVNVWQQLNETTMKIASGQEKRSGTAVCDHCFRTFENISTALLHEANCPRNPDCNTIGDNFHLSSIYREIRPPPPIFAQTKV